MSSPLPGGRLRVEEFDVPMRDGVALRTEVTVPDDGERHPVLLIRCPYSRGAVRAMNDPVGLARTGWAVVNQDVRGRFESEGTFRVFHQEGPDGFDTVDWCARQPWSDGRVAMSGGSYLGAAQWLCAAERPPALGAISPVVSQSHYDEGWSRTSGAFNLGFLESWALGFAASDPRGPAERRRRAQRMAANLDRQLRAPRGRAAVTAVYPDYANWLDGGRDYWKPIDVSKRFGELDLPVFQVAGWYDLFCEGALRDYAGMRAHAATEYARHSQRLIIGPWTHGGVYYPLTAGMDFGPEADGIAAGIPLQLASWLRRALDREEVESGVRFFLMGENRWHDVSDWPPPSRQLTLYLDATDGANGTAGDGSLSRSPVDAGRDSFPYDPANPVPTQGGSILGPFLPLPGPVDQREVEARPDVLVYTSDQLTTPLTIAGAVSARVRFATTGRSADITVKLVDVHPDGRAFNVIDGVRRLDFEPGRTRTVEVAVGSTAMRFGAGHRLRVEISSSNFPRFDLNTTTGIQSTTAGERHTSTQTLHRGGSHASAIVLPEVQLG